MSRGEITATSRATPATAAVSRTGNSAESDAALSYCDFKDRNDSAFVSRIKDPEFAYRSMVSI